jgi:hypothetical protein
VAPPEARVCRACYTVFPKDDPQEDAKPFQTRVKILGGLKYVAILIAAAWVAWFLQTDAELDGATDNKKPSMMADMRAHIAQVINTTLGTESPPSSTVQITQGGRRATQPAVSRVGHCHIRQGVRNIGDEPVSSVVLNVALLDASNKSLDQETNVTTEIDLSAESVGALDLRVPCPFSVARVELSLPLKVDGEPQTIALVESVDKQNVTRRPSDTSMQIALEAAEPSLCPLPDDCKLAATLSSGGSSTFSFYRDPAEPDLLLSDDSILIGHLLTGGTAAITAGMYERAGEIQITYGDLRVEEQPGVLAKWLQKFR